MSNARALLYSSGWQLLSDSLATSVIINIIIIIIIIIIITNIDLIKSYSVGLYRESPIHVCGI